MFLSSLSDGQAINLKEQREEIITKVSKFMQVLNDFKAGHQKDYISYNAIISGY